MAVKLRLTRMGGKHQPYFRIVAAERLSKRDGKSLEILGSYDPRQENEEDKVKLKEDRIKYWLSQGALPSETVGVLLKKAGLLEEKKAPATKG